MSAYRNEGSPKKRKRDGDGKGPDAPTIGDDQDKEIPTEAERRLQLICNVPSAQPPSYSLRMAEPIPKINAVTIIHLGP